VPSGSLLVNIEAKKGQKTFARLAVAGEKDSNLSDRLAPDLLFTNWQVGACPEIGISNQKSPSVYPYGGTGILVTAASVKTDVPYTVANLRVTGHPNASKGRPNRNTS